MSLTHPSLRRNLQYVLPHLIREKVFCRSDDEANASGMVLAQYMYGKAVTRDFELVDIEISATVCEVLLD